MRSGLVRSRRGPGGGYQLARPAEHLLQGHHRGGRRPDRAQRLPGRHQHLQPAAACRMFRVWEHGQRVLLEVFSQTNLQEIVASVPASGLLHQLADTDSAAAHPKA